LRILLDTHLLLWSVASSRRLSKPARAMILDPQNDAYYSAASIWEVSIKSGLGRKDFKVNPQVLVEALAESGFIELPVSATHAAAVAALPALHRDPFDRMLVAQAYAEPMTLLTNDAILASYGPLVRLV
jgi:PIN domain nuclease of toxin-antitoxin system